ncbi:MAG: phosphate acyltransferase PlsX [Gammaproteobacteria bacterium]|jgi:glycerol-3-phosphate acyltransferase PlsX|nr:MAG: phosphate acyltransferase PlsX [Gammaproteobacteria bacterium]
MAACIALDAMGGDHGPVEIIPAALDILKKFPDINLILVGREEVLDPILKANGAAVNDRLRIKHAPEVVEMNEPPSSALRSKKLSSMRLAIDLVRDNTANACVSAGNTGALMAIARFVLKMLPGIERPAICTTMPGINGNTHLLDLGANVDPDAAQLFQYAVMGSELTKAVQNIASPRIALLNVGSEEIKGNDRVKQAASLLANSHLNYAGFVEGNDIYSGNVDVIVCDGFTGNVALKASEGVAGFLMHHVKHEFKKSLYGKLAALISMPVLKSIQRKIDPRRYNGASLLGLKGIVIKSHGSADRLSFFHAIEEAIVEIEKQVPDKITNRLEELLIYR